MKSRWKITLAIVFPVCILIAVGAGLLWPDFKQRYSATERASSQQSSGPAVPDREEALALIGGTMQGFAKALVKKDFTDFYATFSSVWQKQTTPAALAAAFKQFLPFSREVQKSVSGTPFINAQPVIGEKNVLTLQGYYRIEATKMLFSLQYVYEHSAWKLLGMDLQVK
ncbi:MAG: hypothetical protein PHX87_02180 [Candidatus Peribacteraceae bacterium]|nr:hypothetical protein [Candidatus Peribacteraceae bacterium]MDD5742215.1 hypothetical protein [Candidatus Peribacteraceae bacterium]